MVTLAGVALRQHCNPTDVRLVKHSSDQKGNFPPLTHSRDPPKAGCEKNQDGPPHPHSFTDQVSNEASAASSMGEFQFCSSIVFCL